VQAKRVLVTDFTLFVHLIEQNIEIARVRLCCRVERIACGVSILVSDIGTFLTREH